MHEDALIARAARFRPHPAVLLGIGDDAAVLKTPAAPLVWAVDSLVENTHFLRAMPADQIGWKLLAVNLSDFAAMNAEPMAALLSLGLPPDLDPAWTASFWNGLQSACETYGVALAGGDTVRTSEIHLSLSLLGSSARPIARTGAQPGDLLAVTGAFGGAAAGLHCFQHRLDKPSLLARHWHPRPRLREAQALAAACPRLAMLDTSDGLARSLQLLCEANDLGCEVDGEAILVEPGLDEFPAMSRTWVLDGGEDFELLVAVPPECAQALATTGFTVIGRLSTSGPRRIVFSDEVIDLNARNWGYQHF